MLAQRHRDRGNREFSHFVENSENDGYFLVRLLCLLVDQMTYEIIHKGQNLLSIEINFKLPKKYSNCKASPENRSNTFFITTLDTKFCRQFEMRYPYQFQNSVKSFLL